MVAVTVEAVLEDPCPRAVVTAEGFSAGEHVVKLWRFADGSRTLVRGGRALAVVDSFFLEDFEVPFNREVRYEVEVVSGADAGAQGLNATVVVESDCGYIQDPLNPASAVPVYGVRSRDGQAYLRAASFTRLAYEASASRFQVIGSRLPVSISSGRQAPSGIPISMTTRAADENLRLRSLVSECVHLVIRGLPDWGDYLPGSATFEAASVEEQPLTVAMGGSMTRWETTGDQVRPTSKSIVIALWTYQDVAQIFGTYEQKQAAASGFTYLQDQKKPAEIAAAPTVIFYDGGTAETTTFDTTLDGGTA